MNPKSLLILPALGVVVALATAAASAATPSIDAGTHDLLAETAGQQVQLFVTGGDAVEGVNLYIQVGDGTAGPRITSVDLLTGTLFGAEANLGEIDLGSLNDRQIGVGTLLITGSIPADGLLATLTLDTTGVAANTSWDLLLDPVALGTTDFGFVSANLTNGSLNVIPEPTSLAMLLGAATLITVTRRRRA